MCVCHANDEILRSLRDHKYILYIYPDKINIYLRVLSALLIALQGRRLGREQRCASYVPLSRNSDGGSLQDGRSG